MVGDRDFAAGLEDTIGRRLFRHVDGRDLFPTLPSRSAGDFQHIGTELRSTDEGWLPRRKPLRQSPWFVSSLTLSLVAFAMEQLPGVPLLQKLRPRVSLYDHLPHNHLRMSQKLPPGSEFT
jgi:hypothetical protein